MLKAGILGCGSICQKRHALEIDANEFCELYGVYDPVTKRAEHVAKTYGSKVYDSAEALLEDETLDFIEQRLVVFDDSEKQLTGATGFIQADISGLGSVTALTYKEMPYIKNIEFFYIHEVYSFVYFLIFSLIGYFDINRRNVG